MKSITIFLLICLAVTNNKRISGVYATNSTIYRCGSINCRPINGVFQKMLLPHGYVHITTIPAGAYNISITELKNSINLLVLKTDHDTYVLNGDRGPSPSGVYHGAGVKFDYYRNDEDFKTRNFVTEKIFASGFTTKSIDLLILVKEVNHGVKYEYFLPIGSNIYASEEIPEPNSGGNWNELDVPLDYLEENKLDDTQKTVPSNRPRKRKFMWKIIGFGACSKSCGGGFQPPIIKCISETQTRFYSPKKCDNLEKPVLNEKIYRCNIHQCPAFWQLGGWSECFCQQSRGYQERQVRCVRDGSGFIHQIDGDECQDQKPEARRTCECPKPTSRRRTNSSRSDRTRHSHLRGTQAVIPVTNTTVKPRPSLFDKDKSGVWLLSEWSGHCSVECGRGVEHRSLFCDRTPPRTERCDLRTTPDTTRPCESDKGCLNTEWFIGKWGKCVGDCFNLKKSRTVFCIQNEKIVDDVDCGEQTKPKSEKDCTLDEVPYCKPRWMYSEWTECTNACGGGTQRRYVKCLELDPKENTLRESQNCKFSEREPSYSTCNTEKCPGIVVEPRVDLVQNDVIPTCVDEFPNCHLVLEAQLCSLNYYQRNCCYSCAGY